MLPFVVNKDAYIAAIYERRSTQPTQISRGAALQGHRRSCATTLFVIRSTWHVAAIVKINTSRYAGGLRSRTKCSRLPVINRDLSINRIAGLWTCVLYDRQAGRVDAPLCWYYVVYVY